MRGYKAKLLINLYLNSIWNPNSYVKLQYFGAIALSLTTASNPISQVFAIVTLNQFNLKTGQQSNSENPFYKISLLP